MGASADDIALFSGGAAPAASHEKASDDDIAMFSGPAPSTAKPTEATTEDGGRHFLPASWHDVAEPFVSIGHGLKSANDFATNLLARPIDTAKQIASNPGASFREGMRGVNSNIPFANRAVEAAGGPAAVSPEDAAAAPAGLSDFSGLAALPGVGKMVGGIAAKGIEAGAGAVRAADRTIGAKALDIATSPSRTLGAGPIATKIGKYAGKAAGAAVGGHVGGPLGFAVGQNYGGKFGIQAAEKIAGAGDRMINSLAERYLNRAGAAAVPPLMLAPLVHQPLPEPTSVPNGAFGTPFLDEISGEPVTQAGKGGFLPEEAPTNAGGKSPMVSNLKGDVIRDAKSYREGPAEPSGNPAANVEEQLGKTIKILDDLKAAKAAGTLTPRMTQAAVNAGISPKLVYRVTGDESIKGLPFSVKVIGRMKSGEPLTKAVSGASGEEE